VQVIGFEGYGQIFEAEFDSIKANQSFCQIHGYCSPNPQNNPQAAPIQSYSGPHQTCGVFDIYYEDILLNNNWGFNEPNNIGLERRNTVCAVLTYLQGVFNFGQVPLLNHIRIEIEASYQTVYNPAPANWTGVIARATPFFPSIASSTPGYYGGYIYDKVTNWSSYL
jgi:hypothetical protein